MQPLAFPVPASPMPPQMVVPQQPTHVADAPAPAPSAEHHASAVSGSPQSATHTAFPGIAAGGDPASFLTPQRLPSVEVKVSSSRLKPARTSTDSAKARGSEQHAVITLGLFARPDGTELWRVEKDLGALSQLDQELKGCIEGLANFPERGLFSGHAPARIDSRRAALDRYLESVMQSSSNERVAHVLCPFLTKNVIEPSGRDSASSSDPSSNNVSYLLGPEGRVKKEGFLTKRGKNFGGWKARFFSLDGPLLKYYDSPGGPHLGTIRLKNARIGKQSQTEQSPVRGDSNDPDNEYRHAFLILEPKRKDSSSYMRHMLCAESDAERDEWVVALLHYVDDSDTEDDSPTSSSKHVAVHGKKKPSADYGKPSSAGKDSLHDRQVGDALRGVSYENTVQAEPPVHGAQEGQVNEESCNVPPRAHISGPTNGVKIQDAGAWGNKPAPLNLGRDQRKRSIWGFKGRSSSEPLVQAQPSPAPTSTSQSFHLDRSSRPIRPVFGAPLAEATEYSQLIGVDVNLPAVVYRCIEYLDAEDAANEEGIFRLSGSNVVVKSLRKRFDSEGDVNFLTDEQHYDVHAVASLLKMYLRELPSSVLTRELHLDFLHVLGEFCSILKSERGCLRFWDDKDIRRHE